MINQQQEKFIFLINRKKKFFYNNIFKWEELHYFTLQWKKFKNTIFYIFFYES